MAAAWTVGAPVACPSRLLYSHAWCPGSLHLLQLPFLLPYGAVSVEAVAYGDQVLRAEAVAEQQQQQQQRRRQQRPQKQLSDNDCHKYIFTVTILVFNPQFVYFKYVTNTLVHVSL